jgi:predicted phage-related endonuclease
MDKKTTTAKLVADRDTALELAQEMELKAKEMQKQAEVMLEEGYETAYLMLTEERENVKKLQREVARLMAENVQLRIELEKAKGTANNSAVPSPVIRCPDPF